MASSTLFRQARLATLADGQPDLGLVADGAVLVRDGRIAYAGEEAGLPAEAMDAEVVECDGRLVTPGLIDCHTHLVFGGERSNEFEMRLRGATYQEISKAGGGIVSSVRATRAADDDELLASALKRLDRLIAEGTTTVEVKSGYGLDLATEARVLRVARRLGRERDVGIVTSFLGAHALPPEAAGDKDGYIRLVADEMLPALAREDLVDAVDGFCEGIAFSPDQIARVFDAAKALHLPVKLHADQLSDLGGAALAARYGAVSADHLEYTSDAGAAALARAGTVAVLLPGAYYFLREPQARRSRRSGAMASAWRWRPTATPAPRR